MSPCSYGRIFIKLGGTIMKRLISSLAGLAVMALAFTACDSDPSGPGRLTGKLSGYAKLYDQDGSELTDHSGVTVKVEGTSHSARSAVDGKWSIDGLEAGTYILTFSKPGYGDYKVYGYQFVGGGEAWANYGLFQIPTWSITLSNPTIDTSDDELTLIRIAGRLSEPSPWQGARIFHLYVGSTPDVSSEPGKHLFFYTSAANDRDLAVQAVTSTLITHGIPSGQTVYFAAYPTGRGESYEDPITNRTIYPSLSTSSSNVVSIVVP